MEALELMEKQQLEMQKDDAYQVYQNDDNLFKVVGLKTYEDDLSVYEDMLTDFGIMNSEGKVRCAVKILVLKHPLVSSRYFKCVLIGTWVDTDVDIDDEVQVFGKFNPQHAAILIQNAFDMTHSIFTNHFIIVEPTMLLNPTLITSSYPCHRRAILSGYFGGREDVSLSMTKG